MDFYAGKVLIGFWVGKLFYLLLEKCKEGEGEERN